MLRQDPIRKKRGELNLKNRFLVPEKITVLQGNAENPAGKTEPEAVNAVPVVPAVLPESEMVNIFPVVSAVLPKPEAVNAVPVVPAALPEPEAVKAVPVVPTVLPEPEAVKAVAAALPETLKQELAQAVEASETAVRCLRRVQQELAPSHPFRFQNEAQIREVQNSFRSIPAFQTFQEFQERESRLFQRRAMRDSAFAKQQPLLLFPRPQRSVNNEESVFSASVSPAALTNYYVWFAGNGIAVNPSGSFFDDFYRLGGSLSDIHQIILTKPLPSAQLLKEVFEPHHRTANSEHKVSVYIPEKDINGFYEVLNGKSEFLFSVEALDSYNGQKNSLRIHFVQDAENRINVLRFHFNDSAVVQFVDALGEDKLFDTQTLTAGNTLNVFAVQTLDDFYWAAAQTKRSPSGITLFDDVSAIITPPLAACLNVYLGTAARWAPVDSSLICDVPNKRFLDVVRALDSDEACWSDFNTLAFADDPATKELYYFSQDSQDRFITERQEILEAFRYQQHRRKGLYFD